MSERGACRVLALLPSLSVWLASSCASTVSQPRLVPFPEPDGNARLEEDAAGYASALAAVLTVTERRLGLPGLHGTLRLYPDGASLEAGLRGEGYDALYARQVADTSDGVGRPHAILANEEALHGLAASAKLSFLAHELAHVAEYELAGGRRGILDQWLREGLAEWIASQVMDALGYGSHEDRRRAAIARVRRASRAQTLPPFRELLTARAWRKFPDTYRRAVTYDEAFLATDLLIDTRGLEAALDYFRRVGTSDDHLASFARAFGQERSSFEAAFAAHLDRMLE